MSAFRSRSVELSGQLVVAAPPEEAFPLFSPEGERAWVPGWNPELLHPPGVDWAEGQVFRTREASGEAVWVVSLLDRAGCRARYHRVEPDRWVARVAVACDPRPAGHTQVTVVYTFIGLSESGNREIEAMSPADHDAKLARWEAWIRRARG